MTELLASGREAFEQHRWADAYEQLHASDAEFPLAGEDLERLADAARWSRHYSEMLDAFERAEAAYSASGDFAVPPAARFSSRGNTSSAATTRSPPGTSAGPRPCSRTTKSAPSTHCS